MITFNNNIKLNVIFISGALAILARQTNVIWLILLMGERVLSIIEAETPQSISALQDRGIHGTSIHARVSAVYKSIIISNS